MKRSVQLLVLLLTLLTTGACAGFVVRGSGELVTENREVRPFRQIAIGGSGQVFLSQGNRAALSVETDANLMDRVSTEVRGDTLYLGLDSAPLPAMPTALRFFVTVEEIEAIDVSGSGKVTAGALRADDLAIDVSGSGGVAVEALVTSDLEIDVTGSGEVTVESMATESVDVEISGSGDVQVGGETRQQEIRISGSGEYQAGDLRSREAEVDISGSGDARVWATDLLDLEISGSGTVSYYGVPAVNSSGSGAGSVRSLGSK